MKAMKYKLLSLCFFISVSLYAIQTKSKEIRKEIDVDPKVEVVIKNHDAFRLEPSSQNGTNLWQ